MPKVNLSPDEFGDFVAIFLLDSLVNPEVLINNDEYREFAGKLKAKGMKSALVKYYFNVPSDMRVKYKRIKDVLITGEDNGVINIQKRGEGVKLAPGLKPKKKKEGLLKKIRRGVEKAVKKVTGEEIEQTQLQMLVEGILSELDLEEDNG
jgi:hypothetical protein